MFVKLSNRGGSGNVTLPKGDLRLDGLLDDDGEVRRDQEMHVQRIGDGTYLVRAVEGGSVPELEECRAVKRVAAELAFRGKLVD